MWVIILEAVVALSLLFLIVWATWTRRRKESEEDGSKDD